MFKIDDDMTINVTRGDCGTIDVSATVDGAVYVFLPGDILRLKVFEKKNCENVVLKKDFGIDVNATTVTLTLTGKDTKIGGMINKPTNYWYEIELNPETNPQTIVGYDDEGPKLFCLHPEGNEVEETEPDEADVGAFDDKLDLTSNKALPNKVIAQAYYSLQGKVNKIVSNVVSVKEFGAKGDGDKDDTKQILSAISALKEGDTLFFPQGHYKVAHDYDAYPYFESHNKTVFQIKNKNNVTIDLGDSIIELIGKYDQAGNIVESDAIGYNLFEVIDCENFVIKNGTLVGDRTSHIYTRWKDDGVNPNASNSHERGYGIVVRSNPDSKSQTDNICSGEIQNVKMYDFTGDGIITKNGFSVGKITIKDCEIYDCNRQGISVLDSDIVIIDNCYIHDIGIPFAHNDGTVRKGYSPRTGIDVEPGGGTNNVNRIVIKNTTIENTGSSSIISGFSRDNGKTILRTIQDFRIDNCNLQTLTVSAVTTFESFDTSNGENRLLIPITNSVLTHHDCYKYNETYNPFNLGYSEMTNCVINSDSDVSTYINYDGQGNSIRRLFTSVKGITLYNCVVNSSLKEEKTVGDVTQDLPLVEISNIKPINTTINGCKILNKHDSNLAILDCINTSFNDCSFNGTGSDGSYKYVKCSLLNCMADTNNSSDVLKFVACCFDKKFHSHNSYIYIGCVFEDEE